MSAAVPQRRLLCAAPLVVPSLLAAALVAYGTHAGIGLSTDSAAYIGAARGLLAGAGVATRGGDGAMQPMVLYAPLLPALIAGVSALGPEPFAAVRGLHVALAAFNTAMVVWLILRDTGSRGWALASGMVVAMPFCAGGKRTSRIHSWSFRSNTYETHKHARRVISSTT